MAVKPFRTPSGDLCGYSAQITPLLPIRYIMKEIFRTGKLGAVRACRECWARCCTSTCTQKRVSKTSKDHKPSFSAPLTELKYALLMIADGECQVVISLSTKVYGIRARWIDVWELSKQLWLCASGMVKGGSRKIIHCELSSILYYESTIPICPPQLRALRPHTICMSLKSWRSLLHRRLLECVLRLLGFRGPCRARCRRLLHL